MARFLIQGITKWLLGAIVVVLALAIFLDYGIAHAGFYTGTFTSYAFGHKNGLSGHYVDQGSFANHKGNGNPSCGDPAQQWAWGSGIYTTSPITLYSASGSPFGQQSFTLWDSGDVTCSEGAYWVDIYFGRYKVVSTPCTCPGSPSTNAYCVNATDNSCSHAIAFGNRYGFPYYGP